MFTPYLYIGIGETSAFFTLRETYLHETWYEGQRNCEVRSFHHQNLSQDPGEAFEKATKFSDNMGLELRTTREAIERELREIRRASAEEIERRQREAVEREERWAAERQKRFEDQVALAQQGIFPFGRYEDERFEDIPRGFLSWIVRAQETFEEGSTIRAVAKILSAKYQHLLLPTPDPDAVIGQPKQRLVFDVTVTRVHPYTRPSFSGYGEEVVYITTMVCNETKACLICFSGAFCPEEGAKLEIKATVKEHTEYKGQAQTVVQRVAIQ